MLRYKTKTRPGLVTLYDIRPGNGATSGQETERVNSYNPGARTAYQGCCGNCQCHDWQSPHQMVSNSIYVLAAHNSTIGICSGFIIWPNMNSLVYFSNYMVLKQILGTVQDNTNISSAASTIWKWKKRSERRKHCTRAGCSKVRTPPTRPPTVTNPQTGLITIHCAAAS